MTKPEFIVDVIIENVKKECVYFPKIAELEKFRPKSEGKSLEKSPENMFYCEICCNTGLPSWFKWLGDWWGEYTSACICEKGRYYKNQTPSLPSIDQIKDRSKEDRNILILPHRMDMNGRWNTPPDKLELGKTDKDLNIEQAKELYQGCNFIKGVT